MEEIKNFEEFKASKEDSIEYLQKVNEGLFTAAAGAIAGPKVADALCKALGITKGPLYDLFHSSIFCRALGAYLGY